MRRHQTRLFAFLQQMSALEPNEIEDLVQETFVKAYLSLDSFDYTLYHSEKAFGTWLFTIGRRIMLNALRKSKRDRLVFFSASETTEKHKESIPDKALIPEQSAEWLDSRQNLWSKIRKVLTEPQWTALWLQYVENCSMEEIAVAIGKKPQSVKALIHRAKCTLQKHPEIFETYTSFY